MAARSLVARDELAATDVILDIRVVVQGDAVRDAVPDARDHGEPVPFPAALRVQAAPAARLGPLAAVRLVHEAEVEELEAVAFIAVAEAEDRLGLIVGFAQQARVASVVDLPVHALRVAEPQAHAVDADLREERRHAQALEHFARGELGLEAHLELELVPVEVQGWRRAARWTARLGVGTARPARNNIVRAVTDDIRQAPGARLLAAELPGFTQVRRRGRRIDRPAGVRLGGPRKLVVAGDALVDVLELCAACEPFVRGALRTPERRAEQREYLGPDARHWPNL